jgi:hypothetical protein
MKRLERLRAQLAFLRYLLLPATLLSVGDVIGPVAGPLNPLSGVPTISPVGVNSGLGIVVTNNGSNFGPDTPSTTTSGIQEAINYLSGKGGGVAYLIPNNGNFQTSATIVGASNVTLLSYMGGGEIFGPAGLAPAASIQTSVGTGIIFTTPTAGGADSARIQLLGLAFVGTGAGPIVRYTQTRQSVFQGFVQSSAAIAFQIDGATHNSEANYINPSFFQGAPAIQIGAAAETQHANDTVWEGVIAEAPGFNAGAGVSIVKVATQGGNHQFHNFYSRSTTSAANGICFDLTAAVGGYVLLDGGEMLTSGTGLFLSMAGGTFGVVNGTSTQGGFTITGGTLEFLNWTFQTNAIPITVSGGIVRMDRFCQIGAAGSITWSVTAGSVYITPGSDQIVPIGGSGGARFPGVRTADIPTNPPVSGTFYAMPQKAVYILSFPLTPGGVAGSYSVSVSPDGGTTILAYLPSVATLANGAAFVLTIILPAGWSYRVTVSNVTIATGAAFALPS